MRELAILAAMSGLPLPFPQERLRASVVVIGDEILSGFVRDTNSGWLAQRLTVLGIPLDRVVTVPDQVDAIGEALRTELTRRRPRVVITSGGIGSTPDDLTLEAVASELAMGMRVEPSIDAYITKALAWMSAQGMTVTPGHERSMRKMALVPDHAYLLPFADGVAPGVAVDVDGGAGNPAGASIVVLPGVPRELRHIMTRGVEPAFLEGRGEPLHVIELSHGYPESALNPVLDEIVRDFPDVLLGSYPGPECVIRLRGHERRVEEAAELVRSFLRQLDDDEGADRIRERWRRGWEDRMRSDLTPQ
jgi:nicotinamide-nucleotide amidase